MVHQVSIRSVISEDLLAGKQMVDDNSKGLLSILFNFPRNGKRLPSRDFSSEVPWAGLWTTAGLSRSEGGSPLSFLGAVATFHFHRY